MSANRLNPSQRRAARTLATMIVHERYRANLLRDVPAFVEAVADEIAALRQCSPVDARLELAEHHRALVELPADAPPVNPNWLNGWRLGR
jgi:hypothetical protein